MAYTAIDNPELYFQVKLYTGDGSTPSITLDGDTDMQPDLVWIKNRDATDSHCLFDSVRTATEVLNSDANTIETTDADTLTSFDSDGFALGDDVKVNTNTEDYVAWCWKESADAGFDIIAYTGTGSNMDVSHNLSAVPDFFAIKNLEVDQAWRVFHKNMTTADPYSTRMVFSENGAETTSALGLDADPTSSVININSDTGTTNASDEDFVCYAWKDVQGFSKFGSYTGNEDVDGPFVYTGFRPAFVMVKRTSSSAQWQIEDIKRDPFNPADTSLFADSTDADTTSAGYKTDFLSNGFKIRGTTVARNGPGDTYIYMAFAEAPFVNSNGVPCNAR